jgi:glycosyltransferase involved in cell wall biosynthesis
METSGAQRRTLLFVAPIMPAASGNGLAMRAGVFVDALAQDFAVTLLVVPVAAGVQRVPSAFAVERAARIVTLALDDKVDPLWTLIGRIADRDARAAAFAAYPGPALCRHASPAYRAAVSAALAGMRFDVIHVMRSYMAPYAEPLLAEGGARPVPRASLDLDDDEALTLGRIATLAERAGALEDARAFADEAARYGRFEPLWLPRFQLLIAANPAHAQRLAADCPGRDVAVVPNTVALPGVRPQRDGSGTRILFVGNLSYLPNVDGIRRFATDVLPQLRTRCGERLALRIAGSAPEAEVTALAGLPGIELIADPADLADCYAWADLAVVPLAAGGGTRIKLLEAFSHGVPVVATSIGAEGIAAAHGVHLLIGDTTAAFADACAAVLTDRALAARLAENARALVEARHAHAHGVRSIRDAFA